MHIGRLIATPQCRSSADCGMICRARRPTSEILPLPTQPRSYRVTPIRVPKEQDPVFRHSLKRTLEAQRHLNRTRLIRKVYDDRIDPGIYRPPIPELDFSNGGRESGSGLETHGLQKPVVPSIAGAARIQSGSGRRATREKLRRQVHQQKKTSPSDHVVSWTVDKTVGKPVQYPWFQSMSANTENRDGLSQLHLEVELLEKYHVTTNKDKFVVREILRDISTLLRGVVPDAPQLVGSRLTGVALGHSNVDILIPVEVPNNRKNQNRKPSPMRRRALNAYRNTCHLVRGAISVDPNFEHIHMSSGRSRALTMIHKSTGMQISIFCGPHAPVSTEYIKIYVMQHPQLRPLYMAVRMILESNGIFKTEKSSLSPYGLILMITAFLKLHEGRFSREDGLGEQLLAVLETYGTRLNLQRTGIAVDPPGYFDFASIRQQEQSSSHLGPEPAYLRGQRALLRFKVNSGHKANHPAATHLCIQDPANYLYDVGRPCIRTAELQTVLADAHRRLRTAVDKWDSGDRAQGTVLGQVLRANSDDLEQMSELNLD